MFTESKAGENIGHISRWAGIKIHKGVLTYHGFHGKINFKKAIIFVVCFTFFFFSFENTAILIERNKKKKIDHKPSYAQLLFW